MPRATPKGRRFSSPPRNDSKPSEIRRASPGPKSSSTLPSSSAPRNASRSSTPASSHKRRALFGPMSGTASSAATPEGTSLSTSSSRAMVPVSRSSSILRAIDPPTPGMDCSSPRRRIPSSGSERRVMPSAARRYAPTLKADSPRISSKFARRLSFSDTSVLLVGF
jgi:hypothetical protein